MKSKSWFEVDRAGLSKLLTDRGHHRLVYELVANAWDESSTRVDVTLEMMGAQRARLVVVDDNPAGFRQLTNAYTLFAESEKKADPVKRGRFNLGEKLVIAACEEASIRSTTGTIHFQRDGSRSASDDKTEGGSRFEGVLAMTRAEFEATCESVALVLPPAGIRTMFNDVEIPARAPIASTSASLMTVLGDDAGVLRRTQRITTLEILEPAEGEVGTLFEMGIPIVGTGDQFHVSVDQKVPLSFDREQVSPAYLRDVRAAVLNAVHDRLSMDQARAAWVTDALEDETIAPAAVRAVVVARFGERAVTYSPGDREANARALANGYNLVTGSSFSGAAWEHIRAGEALRPASAVFPTPRPYSDDPDAPPVTVVPPERYTPAIAAIVAFATRLGERLLHRSIRVRVVDTQNSFAACFGDGDLDLNLGRLGHGWFEDGLTNLAPIVDLLLHEFAHHDGGHLSDAFERAISRYGGRAVELALREPDLFQLG